MIATQEQSKAVQEAVRAMDNIASKAALEWGNVLHEMHFLSRVKN